MRRDRGEQPADGAESRRAPLRRRQHEDGRLRLDDEPPHGESECASVASRQGAESRHLPRVDARVSESRAVGDEREDPRVPARRPWFEHGVDGYE